MTDKIFDDFMRDKLRNHASPVPEGLWDKIEKGKRRRPIAFFWSKRMLTIGLLLLTLFGIGGYMWLQSNSNQAPAVAATTTTSEQKETINNTINTTVIEKNNTPNTNAIEHTEASITKQDSNKEARQTTDHVPTSMVADQLTIANGNKTINQNVVAENLHSSVSMTDNKVFTRTKKIIYKPYSNTATSSSNNTQFSLTAIDPQKTLGSEIAYTNTYSLFTKGNLVPISSRLGALSMRTIPGSGSLKFTGINDCPSVNGNARNDWYLELFASPDYNMKTVKGNDANAAYIKKKDSSESMRIGYTVGGRITKNFGEHLMLKAGLQFSQLNEHLTLRTENERKITTVVTIKTVTDAAGNTTTVSDTTTLIQIGYAIKTSKNIYRNIELPITLGYEFGNNKWKGSINGGVIVNLASWYKGSILDTSYQVVAVSSKSNSDLYQRTIGLSLYGSISIIKPVTERMAVFAEPYFRYSLSNLNANTLGYNQRFSAAGLSLGIRYKLNAKGQH